MGFSDIIKKSVLEGFDADNLLTSRIVVVLGMAVLMGLFIYMIYRITTKGSFYNRGFNKSLAILPVITAGIILAMQSNLVISLGMVGALSIVRFRNAVKDPADLTFLFWSISMGIVVGAGLFELATLLSLCITVLVIGLDLMPTFRATCLLVVSGDLTMDETAFLACVKNGSSRMKVRSRCKTKKSIDWILEINVRDETTLLDQVAAVHGINCVNLMNHDGEVRF